MTSVLLAHKPNVSACLHSSLVDCQQMSSVCPKKCLMADSTVSIRHNAEIKARFDTNYEMIGRVKLTSLRTWQKHTQWRSWMRRRREVEMHWEEGEKAR